MCMRLSIFSHHNYYIAFQKCTEYRSMEMVQASEAAGKESRNKNAYASAAGLRFVEKKSIGMRNGDEPGINIGMKKLPIMPPLMVSASRFQPTFFLAPLETRQSSINLDRAIEYEIKHGRKLDTQMDRKKLRRTVSNRLSAQRSRQRRAQHILEMERKAKELEVTLLLLEEKSGRLLEKRRLLKEQNEALEHLLLIRQHQADHSQMVLEKNRAELNRLKKGLLESGWSSSSFYKDDEQAQPGMDKVNHPFLNFGFN